MPSREISQLLEVARQLLAAETVPGPSAEGGLSPAHRVCDKLRLLLGRLLGVDGFRLLLARALTLAEAELPDLRGVKVGPQGMLEGLEERMERLDARAAKAGERMFVAHILGLLVIFVGPTLTLRWVQDLWPTITDLDL